MMSRGGVDPLSEFSEPFGEMFAPSRPNPAMSTVVPTG